MRLLTRRFGFLFFGLLLLILNLHIRISRLEDSNEKQTGNLNETVSILKSTTETMHRLSNIVYQLALDAGWNN